MKCCNLKNVHSEKNPKVKKHNNFKWLEPQRDSNPQPFSSETNTQPSSQTGQKTIQKIELCCEYLSVRCIWLYVIIMSRRCLNGCYHVTCAFKLLSNHLRTKWLWVRVPLLSLKLQISRLFWAMNSLTFRQLYSVDSPLTNLLWK